MMTDNSEAGYDSYLGDDAPADAQLKKVAELAQRQVDLEARVGIAAEDLKRLTEELRGVNETDLPEALADAGLTEVTLKSGAKVSVKRSYHPAILADRRDEALTWLRDNSYGDLIKHVVSATFTRGQDNIAGDYVEQLRGQKIGFTDKADIPHQTLKALARERYERGETLPEAFAVHIVQKSTVKLPT